MQLLSCDFYLEVSKKAFSQKVSFYIYKPNFVMHIAQCKKKCTVHAVTLIKGNWVLNPKCLKSVTFWNTAFCYLVKKFKKGRKPNHEVLNRWNKRETKKGSIALFVVIAAQTLLGSRMAHRRMMGHTGWLVVFVFVFGFGSGELQILLSTYGKSLLL